MRLLSILDAIDRVISVICIASAWVLLPTMIAVRTFDIVARQFIFPPSTYLQFVEWRAFLFLVLLSFGYALLRNAHVRVDILNQFVSLRTMSKVEIGGFFVAIVPFCLVMIWYGIEYAHQAYEQGERETLAFGAPVQWMVKGMLPLGFFILLVAGLVSALRHYHILHDPDSKGL